MGEFIGRFLLNSEVTGEGEFCFNSVPGRFVGNSLKRFDGGGANFDLLALEKATEFEKNEGFHN